MPDHLPPLFGSNPRLREKAAVKCPGLPGMERCWSSEMINILLGITNME